MGSDRHVDPVKEKTYVPGSRSSKRLSPRVKGGYPPKRKRRGTQRAEGGSAAKKTNETKETDQEVNRYFTKLRPDELWIKGRRNPD